MARSPLAITMSSKPRPAKGPRALDAPFGFAYGRAMFRALLISAAIVSLPLAAGANEGLRAGSTSLCGDGYLTALALDKISALSWQSRSDLSLASESQRTLPQIWDEPEVLAKQTNTDIIIFGPNEGTQSKGLEIESLSISWGEGFDAVYANAARLSRALNVPDTISPDIKARLAALNSQQKSRAAKPKILYLSSSGSSAGPGTFVDAVIQAAGGANIMTTPGWLTPDIEEIVSLSPDLILLSFLDNSYASANEAAIRNRALQRFIDKHMQYDIHGSYWPCAGPYLIEAAEELSAIIETIP